MSIFSFFVNDFYLLNLLYYSYDLLDHCRKLSYRLQDANHNFKYLVVNLRKFERKNLMLMTL